MNIGDPVLFEQTPHMWREGQIFTEFFFVGKTFYIIFYLISDDEPAFVVLQRGQFRVAE